MWIVWSIVLEFLLVSYHHPLEEGLGRIDNMSYVSK